MTETKRRTAATAGVALMLALGTAACGGGPTGIEDEWEAYWDGRAADYERMIEAPTEPWSSPTR